MTIKTQQPDRTKQDKCIDKPPQATPRRLREDIRQALVVCPDTEKLLKELNQE